VRLAAVVLGIAALGALIVLAVAGVSGATAVLITAGAVVAMIGLGNAVGGRHTPNRAPYDTATDADDDAGPDEPVEDAEPGAPGRHGAREP